MKKTFYIAAMFIVSLTMSGCGEAVDLPPLPEGTETDLDNIPLPEDELIIPLKP